MFKVGDYVTIKKEYSWVDWYHTNPMCILEVNNMAADIFTLSKNSFIYKVDYSTHRETDFGYNVDNTIHHNFVELSAAHIRENKIERLLGDV